MAGRIPTQLSQPGEFASSTSTLSFYHLVVILEVVTILFLCILLISRLLSPTRKAPPRLRVLPGPKGIPWLGPLWQIDFSVAWLGFKAWGDKYGPIYQVEIFGKNWVWISDPQIAHTLLSQRARIYSDRNSLWNVHNTKDGGEFLPFLRYGDQWQRQRKFETQALLDAKNNQYFGVIQLEVRRLMLQVLQKNADYGELFDDFASSVGCTLAYGSTYGASEFPKNANALMASISPAGAVANICKPLSYLPAWLYAGKRHEQERHAHESQIFKKLHAVAKSQKTLPPSQALSMIKKGLSTGFGDKEASYVLGAFPTVAVITITAPLRSWVMAMALHPEWQVAAREELDRVCGERVLELTDSPALPVLRAIIKETLRWRPVTPLGIPHQLEEDDEYNGYLIPKGSLVFAGDWSLSRNEAMYPSAETFNPARWLDPSYPTFKTPLTEFPTIKGYHGFGYGRRACVGQDLVHSELLLACGALLQGFEIQRQRDEYGTVKLIDTEACTPYLISMTGVHPVEFVSRGEGWAGRIRGEWRGVLERERERETGRGRETNAAEQET